MLENHELERLRTKTYLSIGEVARVIDSTPMQIRKWERMGLMPEPKTRRKRGSREDRVYTWDEVDQMLEFRRVFKIGAPTAEEAEKRERIREQIELDASGAA